MMAQSRNNQKVKVRQLARVSKDGTRTIYEFSGASNAPVTVEVSYLSDQPYAAPEADGLNVCLDCWRRWMLSDDRDLSASRMKFESREVLPDMLDADGNAIRLAYETNPYDEQMKADNAIGMATGVMIDGLNKWQRWAIHRKCAVINVWDFPKLDYMATLIDAERELEIKLRKNIATATQF